MSAATTTQYGRVKGAKWLREASYLTEADRAKVYDALAEAREAYPEETRFAIRCPSYIGEPHPIAVITMGLGEIIFRRVHRT